MTPQQSQTWLITGGTGFIGKALVAALTHAQHTVIVLTRSPKSAATHLPQQTECIHSLNDIKSDRKIDCIVNLAGEPLFGGLWTAKRKHAFFESRLSTTQAVVALVRRLSAKPEVMISGSAIGYYGMSLTENFNEDSSSGDDEMARLCREWEATSIPVVEEFVRLVHLRIGLVLHPSGGLLAPQILASKCFMAAKLGTGEQWMSWISRSDLVSLIRFIATNKNIHGPVNATAPTPVTQDDFSRLLANHVGRPRLFKIPAAPLRIALGDMSDLLLHGQKVLPTKAIDNDFVFEAPTLEKAFATFASNSA